MTDAMVSRGFAPVTGGEEGGVESVAGFETQGKRGVFGIQQVARELGITQRTLRFYEDKGLIVPQRLGGMRVYTRREVARMRLILRGKRLGFSLREIAEFLDLYAADPTRREQMRHLGEQVRRHLAKLAQQREAINTTIAELQAMEREVRDWMARN